MMVGSEYALPALPWHEPVLKELLNRLDAETLPNAIAVTSVQGWGIEWLGARIAGMMLNLAETQQQPNVMRELAHPDLRWIEPDGAELKIDQVRVINDFAVQTPQAAPRKVAVVNEADNLNENAANALLKILEEPPANTHIVLLTCNWGRLIPTIRSRTQRLRVAENQLQGLAWLQQIGITLDLLQFQVRGASPITIWQQSQPDSPSNEANGFDITHWLALAGKQPVAASAAEIANLDPELVLNLWYRRLRLHLCEAPIPQIAAPARQLHEFSDQLLSVRRQVRSRNSARSSAGLMIESLLVNWRQISRAAN